MKRFFLMFWNDSSVAERTTRALLAGAGACCIALGDDTLKAVGAGCVALAAAIGAGEKNPPSA